jgi:hypothetical protein
MPKRTWRSATADGAASTASFTLATGVRRAFGPIGGRHLISPPSGAANDRLIDSPLETLNTGDKVRVVKEPAAAVDAKAGAEEPAVKTN